LINKPTSQEIVAAVLIDLLAIAVVGLVVVQISRLLGVAIDEAQAAIKESEERFRTLVEQAGDGFALLDAQGGYIDVNSTKCLQLGYTKEEMLRLSITDIDPLISHDKYVAIFRSLVGKPPITFESVHRRKDGTTFAVETSASIIQVGGIQRALSLVRDITERKLSEETLLRSHGDLARLSRDREHLLEQERARISRHLHDEIGQQLTYLMLQLAHMEKRIKGVDSSLGEELKETSKQAQAMIANIRAVAKSLRPIAIEHDGLIPSLRSSIEELQRISGISCRLVAELGDAIISEPLATTVYRIVQEALTNIARHAKAHTCEVCLTTSQGQLTLNIRDDGIGADPDVLGGHRSLGIIGMKERSSAVGGILTVENSSTAGVLVNASFPLIPTVSEDLT
jgi:PAS domain S-box-containing protein